MNTLHQIRITTLEREIERLRKREDVAYTLVLETENARLSKIAEAAADFYAHPNDFTFEILGNALDCK